jgi:hypothetical protein
MEGSDLYQTESIGFMIFVSISVLGILWFFIHKIWKGRDWARITFLVLYIIGIPFAVFTLLQPLMDRPFYGVLGIGQAVLQLVALVFLFQKSSSEWFKQMKVPKGT